MHQLVHWIQNVKSNVDYCYVWCREETRRVHFARSWTQAPKPVLTDASLPAKVGAEALHVVFSPIKHPSPARGLTDCCCCCARWVGCSSRSLAPRTRRSTASCSRAGERRGDCVRASLLFSRSKASIASRASVCSSYCCCYTRLDSV